MTRKRVLLALAVVGVLGSTAAPALAEDGYTRVCVGATNDPNNRGFAPICAWVPVDTKK